MKTRKVLVFAAVLAVLTVIAAMFHFTTRKAVAEGTLAMTVHGTEQTVDISKFAYEQVTGIRVNGKGEEIPVDAPGVSLKQVLSKAGVKEYEKVTVVSDDSYSAEVLKEEVEEGTRAFLILGDENELRLVVFGDTNSKRSVSNVAQVVVE